MFHHSTTPMFTKHYPHRHSGGDTVQSTSTIRPSTILQHGLLSLLAGRALAESALNATIAASSAAALGINCRGSGYCDYFTDYTSRELWKVIENRIDPNRWYNDGQQVACAGYEQLTAAGKAWWLSTGLWYSGVCAFLQNTGGWQARSSRSWRATSCCTSAMSAGAYRRTTLPAMTSPRGS
ncbi:hypothetical protein PCL_00201 [Purpureocillium lilacinum]|uniref:Killer toxin Kp4 domain-containing protein n=1 Tax=Purpureocillium lilacinum TaxID=33203 RepID=A0A2U3E6F0_PURLI|nr:hypothetical protein PCL_00201 [Purpureocillium lilacinum]